MPAAAQSDILHRPAPFAWPATRSIPDVVDPELFDFGSPAVTRIDAGYCRGRGLLASDDDRCAGRARWRHALGCDCCG